MPDRPGAWLTTVARRNALDVMRRRQMFEAKLPLLLSLNRAVAVSMVDGPEAALALSDDAAEQEFLAEPVRSTQPTP